jgi:hypothetical protein
MGSPYGYRGLSTCGGAPANGHARVRAPTGAGVPRVTGLSPGACVMLLRHTEPTMTSSDWRSLGCLGVRARGTASKPTWRGSARRRAWRVSRTTMRVP